VKRPELYAVTIVMKDTITVMVSMSRVRKKFTTVMQRLNFTIATQKLMQN
jgi:hypothetical protein